MERGINQPVNEELTFRPPRRLGQAIHFSAILGLAVLSILGVWQASLASIGPVFLFFLLPSLAALGIIPFLAYRTYALQTAVYTVERDAIRLRWGLRVEDIPMPGILWVYPATELHPKPPLPRLRWPGSVVGVRHVSGAGTIEYLASRSTGLLVVATAEGYYAISPADTEGFLQAFQRFTEMGSLIPAAGRSIYPSFLLLRVWATPPARWLLLSGTALSLALLVWVSLVIPTRGQVNFGFHADGTPGDPAPAVRLLLLPLLNTFFFVADFLLGMFFFRREDSQSTSYILWASGALIPVLFMLAVFLMLQSG